MRLALVLPLLAPLAGATTYVVDVANGPGTDFTQISTAIAAVDPGDTLLVRPGVYAPFVLDKNLAIVGQGTDVDEVRAQGIHVVGLPTGTTTVLANIDQSGFSGFTILNNLGALLIDDSFTNSPVSVGGSYDVRLRRFEASDGIQCTSSRVEVADSLVRGGVSSGGCLCCNWPNTPPAGPAGMFVSGGEVHLARTTVIGGKGGMITCADTGICDGDGGPGGTGIQLVNGARLVASGTSNHFVQGGPGGSTVCASGNTGVSGKALVHASGCEVRLSGISIVGAVEAGGTTILPDPADPTLFALGSPGAGSIFTLRVAGPVGSTVDVVLGRRPTLAPTPALDEEPLAPVHRVFPLGPMDASGTISLNYPVPASWPKGFSVVFQSRLTLSDGTIRYTNSVPAIVP